MKKRRSALIQLAILTALGAAVALLSFPRDREAKYPYLASREIGS